MQRGQVTGVITREQDAAGACQAPGRRVGCRSRVGRLIVRLRRARFACRREARSRIRRLCRGAGSSARLRPFIRCAAAPATAGMSDTRCDAATAQDRPREMGPVARVPSHHLPARRPQHRRAALVSGASSSTRRPRRTSMRRFFCAANAASAGGRPPRERRRAARVYSRLFGLPRSPLIAP